MLIEISESDYPKIDILQVNNKQMFISYSFEALINETNSYPLYCG